MLDLDDLLVLQDLYYHNPKQSVWEAQNERDWWNWVLYVQEFRISCADEEYSTVLEFLRTDEYRIRNIFLKDIDVTKDYFGSFDKDEVSHHLIMTTNEGFRTQRCTADADRTILDNNDQVRNNCFTYMETVQGVTTRCKI